MANKMPSGKFLNDGEKRDLAHTHGIQARSHTVTKPGVHGESNPRLHEIKAPVKQLDHGVDAKTAAIAGSMSGKNAALASYRTQAASIKAYWASERQHNYFLTPQQINQGEKTQLQALYAKASKDGILFNAHGEPMIGPIHADDPIPGLNPNRQKAVDYANNHALGAPDAIGNHVVFNEFGSDCTDFVSKCLKEGGFKVDPAIYPAWNTEDKWSDHGNHYGIPEPTLAWMGANSLHNYLLNNSGAGTGGPTGDVVSSIPTASPTHSATDPLALSHAGLVPGDVVFYNWNHPEQVEGISHAAIYVGQKEVPDPYTGQTVLADVVDYHTDDNLQKYWALHQFEKYGPDTTPISYTAFHMHYPGD